MVRISRLFVAASVVGLLVSGCTIKKTEQPPLTGPSELALSITLTANPDILTEDGSSQSRIVILARDVNANPVKGVSLHATMFTNKTVTSAGSLSSTDVSTGTDGRATITYTAPPMPPDNSDQGIVVTVSVTPIGSDYANALPRVVNIRLVPPSVVPNGPVAAFDYSPHVPVVSAAITFDGSTSTGGDSAIVGYSWDFGDGSTGTGVSPQHTYRVTGDYLVSLVVTSENGRTSYVCKRTISVVEAEPPKADFVYSPSAIAVNQTVFFDASTSSAGTSRRITDYSWSFGNGSTARGVTTTASFSIAGTYTVVLVVTDDVGQKSTKTTTITVGSSAPTASFTTGTASDSANGNVVLTVDASGSRAAPGLAITAYSWDFGDTTGPVTNTASTATHIYPNPGMNGTTPRTAVYTVTLTVIDTNGSRASVARAVTITGF